MVVPPMQSINGDDEDTFGLHTCGLPHGRYARFAMPAMFGASATGRGWLLFHSCDFKVRLLSHHMQMHLRLPCAAFFDAEFCTWLEWELSWGSWIPGTTPIPGDYYFIVAILGLVCCHIILLDMYCVRVRRRHIANRESGEEWEFKFPVLSFEFSQFPKVKSCKNSSIIIYDLITHIDPFAAV